MPFFFLIGAQTIVKVKAPVKSIVRLTHAQNSTNLPLRDCPYVARCQHIKKSFGARREGRTPTLVKEPDFESGASASSAIRAIWPIQNWYLWFDFYHEPHNRSNNLENPILPWLLIVQDNHFKDFQYPCDLFLLINQLIPTLTSFPISVIRFL